ncbi:TyrR/PhhR family helix-turn-helix DNA-binding protein [Celerinatantimonas sp. YJH-8]|uniref:TyrR/PhhR family helix-turn-helix DNA-binding protein n=1 Tax=Celerinatantimonas sp. YJH-8 TaxID=3228714 RepID=UPI0038C4E9C7
MTRLEIGCRSGTAIVSKICQILDEFGVNLSGMETNNNGFLYLVISELPDGQLPTLLTKLRYLEEICDARVVGSTPAESGERENQLLLNRILSPVLLIDRNGLMIQVNQAFIFASGIAREFLIGQPLSEFIKGFSFSRWLGNGQGRAESVDIYLDDRPYSAQIEPVSNDSSLADLPAAMMLLQPDSHVVPDLDLASVRDSFAPFGLVAHHPSYVSVVAQLKQIAEQPRSILLYGEQGCGRHFSAHLLNHFQGNSAEQAIMIDGLISDAILDEQLLDIAVSQPMMVIINNVESLQVEQFERLCAQMHHVAQVVFISLATPNQLIEQFGAQSFYAAIEQCLEILPLRMRSEDIVPLAQAWIDEQFLSAGKVSLILAKSVQQFLKKCSWPGNIAQLLQVLRDTMTVTGLRSWAVRDIKYSHQSQRQSVDLDEILDQEYHQAMSDFEKMLISYHYPHYPSTRSLAKRLGLSHTAVAKKLREHKIT